MGKLTERVVDAFGDEHAFWAVTVSGDRALYSLTVEAWQNILPLNGYGVYLSFTDEEGRTEGLYLE